MNFNTLTAGFILLFLTSICSNNFGQSFLFTPNSLAPEHVFMTFSQDARSTSMGNTGVADHNPVNASFWNPAGLIAEKEDKGFNLSINYMPQFSMLIDDISLVSFNSSIKISNNWALGASLSRFSLGELILMDNTGTPIRSINANDISFGLNLARKLNDNLKVGASFRYLNSNYESRQISNTATFGNISWAYDLSMLRNSDEFTLLGNPSQFSYGINISNINTSKGQVSDLGFVSSYIPTNLRTGVNLKMNVSEKNQFRLNLDLNKLLTPSRPIFGESNGNEPELLSGRVYQPGVLAPIFGSFTDAPGVIFQNENNEWEVERGSRLNEELQEIRIGIGGEFLIDQKIAIRAGYSHEHESKGYGKFLAAGLGIRFFKTLTFDASYIL